MTEDSDRRAASELRRIQDQHAYRLDQLNSVPGSLQDIDRRLRDMEQRQVAWDSKLEDNTSITQQIRDAQIAGKVLAKLLGWISGIAAAAAGIWGAVYQLTHWKSP